MTKTATAKSLHCEICGDAGARTVSAVSGGEMDACKPCERDEWKQAKIDANANRMGDMNDAEADAFLATV